MCLEHLSDTLEMESMLWGLLYSSVCFELVNSSCDCYMHSNSRVDDWQQVLINTCPTGGRVQALEFNFVSNGSSGPCVETFSLYTKELVFMRIDMTMFDIITCGSVSTHAACGSAFGSVSMVSVQTSGVHVIEFETPANKTLQTPDDTDDTSFFGQSYIMQVSCGMETLHTHYKENFQVTFERDIGTTYIQTFLSTLTTVTETPKTKTPEATEITAMTKSIFVKSNNSLKSTLDTTTGAKPSRYSTRQQYGPPVSFFDDPVNIAVVALVCGAVGLGSCGIMIYSMKNRICRRVVMVAGTTTSREDDTNDGQSV